MDVRAVEEVDVEVVDMCRTCAKLWLECSEEARFRCAKILLCSCRLATESRMDDHASARRQIDSLNRVIRRIESERNDERNKRLDAEANKRKSGPLDLMVKYGWRLEVNPKPGHSGFWGPIACVNPAFAWPENMIGSGYTPEAAIENAARRLGV